MALKAYGIPSVSLSSHTCFNAVSAIHSRLTAHYAVAYKQLAISLPLFFFQTIFHCIEHFVSHPHESQSYLSAAFLAFSNIASRSADFLEDNLTIFIGNVEPYLSPVFLERNFKNPPSLLFWEMACCKESCFLL